MTTITERYEKLTGLVRKLEKNMASIPEKDQKERYKKAFRKIKEDIRCEAEVVFPYLVVSGFHVLPEDKEAFLGAAGNVVAKAKESGYPRKLGDALTVSCNMELFFTYALLLQCNLAEQFYADYWLRHTMNVEGRYYNDLVRMWYDEKAGLWRNDRDRSFGIFFPPEKEAFLAQAEKSREDLTSFIKGRAASCSRCA